NDTYSLHGTYGGTWGGNNATDALIVQLNILGTYPLAGIRAVVADVNASSTITALDALYIKLRTVGSVTSYPAGDWKVTDTTVTLTGISAATVDLPALCVGDVNGSFSPLSFKETNSLSVSEDGVMAVPVGEPFIYTIRAGRPANLGAMTLHMGYDSQRFEVIDVAALPDGMKYVIGQGKISVAWSDINPMNVKPGDVVLSLSMRVKQQIAEPSQVFTLAAGSEFADILAVPYDNFNLKMSGVVTPDGTRSFSMSNYPNPFSGNTTIIWNLPENGHVRLVLTDMTGHTISTLADRQELAGVHSVVFDPSGLTLAPGVYLCKIIFDGVTDKYVKVNKMVFMR
ncbi:MAG: T9SS type A sorting domain-containing protein, partial [Bacteroidota bacterium]